MQDKQDRITTLVKPEGQFLKPDLPPFVLINTLNSSKRKMINFKVHLSYRACQFKPIWYIIAETGPGGILFLRHLVYVELILCCLQVPDTCLLSLRIRLLVWKTPCVIFWSLIKPSSWKTWHHPRACWVHKPSQYSASRTRVSDVGRDSRCWHCLA